MGDGQEVAGHVLDREKQCRKLGLSRQQAKTCLRGVMVTGLAGNIVLSRHTPNISFRCARARRIQRSEERGAMDDLVN